MNTPIVSVEWLQQNLERMKILPSDSDSAWTHGFFNVYKNNIHTDLAYQPQDVQSVDITLFAAEDRSGQQNRPEIDELVAGWSSFGGVQLMVVPGTHFSMMTHPYVQELGKQIFTCLNKEIHQ